MKRTTRILLADYRQKTGAGSAVENVCPGTVATTTAGDDFGHSGTFGVHELFDTQEFPGATDRQGEGHRRLQRPVDDKAPGDREN